MVWLMRKSILAVILGAVGLTSGGAWAAGPSIEAVTPAAQAFTVGKLHLWSLHDVSIQVPNDAQTFGVDAGVDAVSQVLTSAGAPTNQIALSVNALLLREGNRVLLFDTGVGEGAHGALLASLKGAGVAPEAVTDVLITHPHFDHITGLVTASGAPVFTKATIRLPEAAWAWMQEQSPQVSKAIAAQVQTFKPGALITPAVKSVPLAGHTPGHTGYEITSGNAKLLDIGDLAHSSIVSLAKPQWLMGFDQDKTVSKATRLAELPILAKTGELLFSPHFPYPALGHIQAQADAFTWKPGL